MPAILEYMDCCPYCGEADIQLGHSRLQRIVRLFKGSCKRYCPECRTKWLGKTPAWISPDYILGSLLVCAVLLSPFAAYMVGPILEQDAAEKSLEDPESGKGESAALGQSEDAAADVRLSDDPYRTHDSMTESALSNTPGAERQMRQRKKKSAAALIQKGIQGMMGDISDMLKMFQRDKNKPGTPAHDLENLSKKELWDKYGKLFNSKDEAKAAYEKYQREKASMVKSGAN